MTISSSASARVQYSGNGTTTAFSFPYPFTANADLKVYLRNTTTGAETLQTITTHYTVTGAGNPAGGTVTFVTAPTTSQQVVIYDDPSVVQETDYVENDPFPAASHESALDRLTRVSKRLKDRVDRTFRLSDADTSGASTVIPTPTANNFLAWNAAALALQNVTPADVATITAYGTTNADVFSGDGVTTSFTLSNNPGALNNLDVSIGGVTQTRTIDYTWGGGTTLTFVAAPPNGTNNIQVRYQRALAQGTMDAGSVEADDGSSGSIFSSAQGFIDKILDELVYVTSYTTFANAITAAAGKRLVVPGGATISVTTDTVVPADVALVVENGASITVSSGKTLNIRGDFQAGDYVVFHGAGTVSFLEGKRHYNLAWFEGSFLNEKWDFARRGFVNLIPYTAVIPAPLKGDTAATFVLRGSTEQWLWKVSAPLYFDDPENMGTWEVHGQLIATSVMAGVLSFSPTNKTEDITFLTPILIDCDSKAANAVYLNGGARIKFEKQIYALNCADAVYWTTATHPISGCKFNDIYVSGFTSSAFKSEGVATAAIQNWIGNIEAEVAGNTSAQVVKLIGNNDGLDINSVYYITSGGSVPDAGVYIEGNANGRPTNGMHIGMIYGNGLSCGLKTRLSVGTTAIQGVVVDEINPSHSAAVGVDAQYLSNSKIHHVGAGHTNTIDTATCSGLEIAGAETRDFSSTVAISFATPGDVSVTYSTRVATATKRGGMVRAQIALVTSAFTHTTASGSLVVTGLPWTAKSGAGRIAVGSMQYSGITAATTPYVVPTVQPGESRVQFRGSGSGVANVNIATGQVPTGGTVVLILTIEYEAA